MSESLFCRVNYDISRSDGCDICRISFYLEVALSGLILHSILGGYAVNTRGQWFDSPMRW